ncbi:MAG: hypothetical protein AABY15_08410 [Nanoarchaeota archaeon]
MGNKKRYKVRGIKFDIKRVYWHEKTPKEIAKWIERLQDKKLQVVILPTSEKTCDFVIRDIPIGM